VLTVTLTVTHSNAYHTTGSTAVYTIWMMINRYMDNMQDILKNYYASGGKNLFTVVKPAKLAEASDT